MTDNSQPHTEIGQNNDGDVSGEHRQAIFDERFGAVMDGFGKACEDIKIPLAIAIAVHPDEDIPLIFIRGHEFDVAALLAQVLRKMKGQFSDVLSGEAQN